MNSQLKLALSVAGYLLGAAAGIAGIVVGAMQSEPGYIVIGVAFLLAVVVAFIAGATATPQGSLSGPKFGGKFTPPDWAWWVAAGIVVVGMVIGGILLAM
ncbi:hypothetical protein NQ156_04420 [Microbacterium sp. zg.Y625]|uniref:hypothetical protein n=1 Tax=Microbacterium jiangjiandongii TaxID=3049071 RepID=UPI00214D0582|nr:MULTISPECIES: hypothetical protein [unclassified Microbacterium]MCR2792303.1 hypothetical protein [Microbacterium sp. zg.Y625]WIM25099.1 hypothetical protein QNO14_13330 [Microbacterium sp. zg-Y625]